MSLKILGGEGKGLTLLSPNTDLIQPTSSMLKRKLFDAYQNMHDRSFYDLCCGVGSMGLEAYSRGASFVELIDISSQSLKITRKNVSLLKSKVTHQSPITISKMSAIEWLMKNSSKIQSQDIVYFDPPYQQIDLYYQFALAIRESSSKGLFFIEACRQKSFKPEQLELWGLKIEKVYKQGSRYMALCY